MAHHHAFIFVGAISRMQTVERRRCKSGIEKKSEYAIDELLWNDPDSYARNGGKASKGYIDCNQKRLPAPFAVGTKVIAYCETGHGYGDTCFTPVQYSDAALKKVQSWIDELRAKEGDPALLQIHEHLRDSLELAPERPLIFAGEITWIEKLTGPRVCLVCVEPRMRLSVSHLLWGYGQEREVESPCPHSDCSALSVGAKVIVFCRAIDPLYAGSMQTCPFLSTSSTDENLRHVEQWTAEARKGESALILDKIRKSLDAHANSELVPQVYRGHADSIGQSDTGFPVVRFVDTAEAAQAPRDVSITFPLRYSPNWSLPVEIGKPMITFCYERDNMCYADDEDTGIIDDSDATFQIIREMIAHR